MKKCKDCDKVPYGTRMSAILSQIAINKKTENDNPFRVYKCPKKGCKKFLITFSQAMAENNQ